MERCTPSAVLRTEAQQSCVPATALEQKIMRGLSIRINQKSKKKMFKNDQNTDQKPIKYDPKSTENRSTINHIRLNKTIASMEHVLTHFYRCLVMLSSI